MLKIAPNQMAAFSTVAEAGFLGRLLAFFKDHFPDAAEVPNAELIAELGEQVVKAQAYDLLGEREIVSYLLAARTFGADFDRVAGVSDHLARNESSVEKALFLEAMVLLNSNSAHASISKSPE